MLGLATYAIIVNRTCAFSYHDSCSQICFYPRLINEGQEENFQRVDDQELLICIKLKTVILYDEDYKFISIYTNDLQVDIMWDCNKVSSDHSQRLENILATRQDL